MNAQAQLSLAEKVQRRTVHADGDACWTWSGTIHHRGYGMALWPIAQLLRWQRARSLLACSSATAATKRSGFHAARCPRGDRHGRSKLPEVLRAAVRDAARSQSQRAVGASFGISQSRVSQLMRSTP